jgi:predicted XRE-type DNA-binding protein
MTAKLGEFSTAPILTLLCYETCWQRKPIQHRNQRLIYASQDSKGTTMKQSKKNNLEAAGWKVSTAADFLSLSADEAAYIELKLALSDQLRKRRLKKKLTQIEVAEIVASSQSRVAKMEAGDATVTVDLLVKSLLALGATRRELATAIAA